MLIFAISLNTYFQRLVRKRTKELIEREKFLRAVFSAIQDGISVLDTEMRILMVNPTMERWYGEVVGRRCYEAYRGRDRTCDICPTVEAIKSGEMRSAVVPGPGNGLEWVELYSYPVIEDGEVKMVVEFVRDITQREKMHEELEKTLQRYEYLWNNANDIFFIHDLDGKILDYNRKAKELMKGVRVTTIWDVISENYRDFVREKIEEIKSTKNPTEPFEVPLMINGNEIWLEVVAHPVIEDGKLVAIHGIAREITERRMLIEEIGENIMLVSYLVDRIRNPLAAARAFCEIKDEMGEEVFDKVIKNIDKATSLISELDKVWNNLEKLRRGLKKS